MQFASTRIIARFYNQWRLPRFSFYKSHSPSVSTTTSMTSPPATPPREVTFYKEDWRFEESMGDCEWAEDYRPGGFHPVNLGDTFCDGKYKVIRKLGEGSFSTAWLAVSTGKQKYVALKVTTAEPSTASNELTILDHLSKAAHKDPNSAHVMQLLDNFRHEGPNGIHHCLVFEPMGASAASLVEEMPENNPKMWGIPQRYPKQMAKQILLHALRGLSFLHQNGVVHGDFQPGNLLFSIDDIEKVEQQHLEQSNDAKSNIPLLRLDGKIDRWAPAKLYVRESLHDHARLGPSLCVKVSDFGAAFLATGPRPKAATPLALRAPELILKQDFDSSIDIWSFGCLMYEFLTSDRLFGVMIIGYKQEDRDDADDDHFIQMHHMLRPLSKSVMQAWPRSSRWFDHDGNPVQQDENNDAKDGIEGPYIFKSLEQRFAKNKHPDIDDEEAAVICQLIRDILVYDPTERPSAAELLKHPWFSE